ncbi:hydrogenase maturation protease [Neptunomonas antarctica]|uniref:Hydrogenase maturation protease n=1 Tax=Neptunomonas antarctica TaxID=619304 RepID=A0A1N7L3Z4_9GAMM|nr:hydrogenase maturation protease [Neptunomonas antarctica]SIS68595.1 hydrogenase maturation protease [Neptunomonas antarctica]
MKPLIISIGNRYRCDDGVGPYTFDLLKPILAQSSDFIESTGDTSALLDIWQDRDKVILIDACCSASTADAADLSTIQTGQIFRLDGLNENLPADNPVSSNHAISIANAIELARLLHQLPKSLTIYSIAGNNFSQGDVISPRLVIAAQKLAALICNELNSGDRACTNTP